MKIKLKNLRPITIKYFKRIVRLVWISKQRKGNSHSIELRVLQEQQQQLKQKQEQNQDQ